LELGIVSNRVASNNKRIKSFIKTSPLNFQDNLKLTNNLHSLRVKICEYMESYDKTTMLSNEVEQNISITLNKVLNERWLNKKKKIMIL